MGFKRTHKPPKKCRMGWGPISTWSPRARYLFQASLKRYLKDPERKKWHDTYTDTILKGEIGFFESFRLITSEVEIC